VEAAGLRIDDTLEVSWVNGAIMLVPKHAAQVPKRSMRRFLGAGGGHYGEGAEGADAYVRDQRDGW
jgi:hypothetical protein